MKNIKNWLENIITNAWVGKATVKGLTEAMDDLNYAWGTEGMGPFTGTGLAVVKEDKHFPVKLAA
ncbi:MAG: hypothetical protein ABFD81_06695 [Syntrophaceae bacterium]